MKTKTCGREANCDLVLAQATVSRLHAHIELGNDGLVVLQDANTSNGTFLNRNERWIRVKRVTLCIGDRIRFGDYEVPIEKLTAVFGSRSNARLESRHFPPRTANMGSSFHAELKDAGNQLQKPRRNPVTGRIEEEHSS